MSKQYWFTIEAYVHISIKKDSLLLYNTLTGEALEYSGKRERKILHLVKKLQSPGNLRVILLTQDDMEDPAIRQFVNNARKYFMGDLIDTSYSKKKPVQMTPIVNIKKDVKFLKKDASRSVGEDIMTYLTEVFLYIDNRCKQNCGICGSAYKQFSCCTIRKNRNGDMDPMKIRMFMEELKSCSLTSLNILGGDIFTQAKFAELLKILNSNPVQKTFYSHYLNVIKGNEDRNKVKAKLKLLDTGSSSLKILVTFPMKKNILEEVIETIKTVGFNSEFVFIIQSEEECEKAETLVSSYRLDNYDFQPFYNGKNLEFFRQNVFLEKNEILQSKPTLNDIFQNSMVNKLNFGRLTVFPNGDIYANVNAPRLGVLGRDSLYDMLYKEMYQGKNWRKIRKNVMPCKSCTFESLCPPISNYNHAIGRNNLCDIIIKTDKGVTGSGLSSRPGPPSF